MFYPTEQTEMIIIVIINILFSYISVINCFHELKSTTILFAYCASSVGKAGLIKCFCPD